MKRILTLILFVFLTFTANANEINKVISSSGLELKSTISIYAKDMDTNKTIYAKNEDKLLLPASILKALTFGAAYKVLGADYRFETSLYKDSSNNYYVKLAGDPLLSKQDLIDLFKNAKISKINTVYIDDTIIDKTPYPSGWMEEDMWPNQRTITPYIVDKNMFNIDIKRSALATKVDVVQEDSYRLPVINNLELGDKQDYQIKRIYGDDSPIIAFEGTIANDESLNLPVLNPEINFNIKLSEAIKEANLRNTKRITVKKVPDNAQKIISISHGIDEVSKNILLNSDNFSSEVVFKVGAAKFINYDHSATLDDAINMFDYIYRPDGTIKITDGSGVSRNNFVSARFVADSLQMLLKDENYKNLLATSSQGTLKDRLPFLEDNLRAKTGTMEGASSIAGCLTSKENKNIVFVIITQNSLKRKAILKNFENNIITVLYRKY